MVKSLKIEEAQKKQPKEILGLVSRFMKNESLALILTKVYRSFLLVVLYYILLIVVVFTSQSHLPRSIHMAPSLPLSLISSLLLLLCTPNLSFT